jgi:glyoxylase-like metal-dependent hydrolase (beta-lactamase superfamily II)
MRRTVLFLTTMGVMAGLALRPGAAAQISTVKMLAPDVYFHQGDIDGKGHCNTGWIIFDDYVLVVDANFPSGAREVLPKIQAQTNKPIRFAFDTHHHGDHAYGNQIWADAGAVPVAHENVVAEMKRLETGFFGGGKPGRWEDAAKGREDVRSSRLKPPTLLYRDVLIFDDGKHRVELRYFGVGHTRGDGFAWLPNERILFSGDAAVNGPYNYFADGDSAAWVDTLAKVQGLGAAIVAPGHGPSGTGAVLEAQRQFFIDLRAEVARRKDLAPERVQADVRAIRDALLPRHGTYIDAKATSLSGFEAQVAKVYSEMTGKALPRSGAADAARLAHERHHGIAAQ